MTGKNTRQLFMGLGTTLEKAVEEAHGQIPLKPGRDFVICRVIEWGYQRGGFADTKLFYARVIEDDSSPFMT